MGSELCVCLCVCVCVHCLTLCLASLFFLASSASVRPSVFESIKYLGPIHLLLPRSLSLLPICFSPHPFLHLVAFPVSLVPVLVYRSVSLWHSLSARLFLLLGFSYLREAEAPPLFQTMFLSSFLPLFLFLSLFRSLSTPPFLSLSLLGLLLSKAIAH